MESAIIAELAWAATRRGHATLRFNYRGVGASAGAFTDERGSIEDASAALAQLRETTGAREVAVAGIGYGAEIAAALAREDEALEPLIAIASEPPLERFTREVLLVVAEEEDAARKAALASLVSWLPHARLAVIPKADRAFLRGLVDLGRVVAETLSPPGFIDIDST
jgi:hypothetical protein